MYVAKIKTFKKMYKSTFKKTHVYHDLTMLGYYLAGVWEGDGHTKKNPSSGKTSVHITMHKKQAPCVTKLLALLSRLCDDPVGSVHVRDDNNSCVLNVYTPRGLTLIVQLMCDKLQTPKAIQLNDVIDWLNTHHNTRFNHVHFKQQTALDLTTPWFAGFTETDGSFGIDLSTKTRLKVSCQFQMNQRRTNPKSNNLEYSFIFNAIASTLDVNLHTIMEKKSGRYYYAIKATSRKSKDILRRYFDTYPLLTSKFLDYKDWCAVDDLLKEKKLREHLEQIQAYKAGMNDRRHKFTWEHLLKF